jgi:hypothetical protein
MWRHLTVLSMALPLVGLSVMTDSVRAADTPDVQRLLERIRALEERLDKLEQVEVIKKTVEYVCPGGEILDQPPPGGRCPEGGRPQVRETVSKSTVFGSNDFNNDLWSGPFVIGEVDHHSARLLDGNYRLWARVGRLPDDRQRQTWGMGVSLDQLLTPQFGVFARAGFSQADGVSRTSYAASTGPRLTSPLWSRPRDGLGVGYSFQRESVGDEHLAEVYYNLFLTDRFSLIGNMEWLVSGPNQVTGQMNHNVVIPGLRAVVGF